MTRVILPPRSLRGEVTPPGDKSISHRAALLSSVARGEARLANFSPSADCAATLDCMEALGAGIERGPAKPGVVHVAGVGEDGLREPVDVLCAGNSGTTMRLLSGLLSAQPFLSIITGDDSLRSRPMDRVVVPLRLMGADVWGRAGGSLAPLAIKGGALRGIDYALPVASAQVKSALLIAGLYAGGSTTLREPAKSRDHTERLMAAMGVDVTVDGLVVSVRPLEAPLDAMDMEVPGDISSAAYWMVAGAVHPDARLRVNGVGVNPTRTGIVDVLLEMGARLRIENQRRIGHEPVGDIVVESSQLTGVELRGDLIPRLIDEIPVLAVAACFSSGDTVIGDAAELRVKESDRIGSLVKELRCLGAAVEETSDGLIVHGGGKISGGECHSHGDHRLAMALGVAALLADGETALVDDGAVEVSYPAFWQEMDRLRVD